MKRLTRRDAIRFVNDVKVVFQDEREKYDEFIKIMTDFKAYKITTIGVYSRVKELFKGHEDLISKFNNFLPKGYKMGDELLTRHDALGFLKAVKVAFPNNKSYKTKKYDEFLKVMTDFKAKRIDRIGVISRVRELFKEHIHLILGFNNFLPNGYQFIITNELIIQLISRM